MRTRRIEALGLALLAALPVVPYLAFVLRSGVPRSGVVGDVAILEQHARHVRSAATLLGLPSRFGWHQPGPLYAWLAAPFLGGATSTGLHVATCLVTGAAAGAIVASARLFARRAHAAAALLVVLAWFGAFGNASVYPWPPAVVALPSLAFLVAIALFARGKTGAALPAIVSGAFAFQTHVACAPLVAAAGIAGIVAFGASRRRDLARRDVLLLAGSALLLVVLSLPIAVEALASPGAGNLGRIAGFFRHGERTPWREAFRGWLAATAWLPERIAGRALTTDGVVPAVLGAGAMASAPLAWAAARFALELAGLLVAARRRDVPGLFLFAFAVLADAIAIVSLHLVRGPLSAYLVFATAAASTTLAWIGGLGALFAALGPWLARRSASTPVLAGLGLAAAVAATSVQRWSIASRPFAPATRPDLRAELGALVAALGASGRTLVVHRAGATAVADAVVLELERSGVAFRVANGDRDAYAGLRGEAGATDPVHVWLGSDVAACSAAPLARSGVLAAWPSEACVSPR